MAKKTSDTVRLNFEIELKAEHIPILADGMIVPEGTVMTDTQKVRDMAELLLTQMATGGILFPPEDVKLIEDSTGVALNTAEELIPLLADSTHMIDGMHRLTVMVDPAYYPAYEELAQTQEKTVDSIMQEVVDMVQENQWVYELYPRPRTVLMTEADAADLEQLLGAKFSTGSELAKIVRQKLTGEEDVSLFTDETEVSHVGMEG